VSDLSRTCVSFICFFFWWGVSNRLWLGLLLLLFFFYNIQVGRQGVVTMEESKTAQDNLAFVEGMQFDRGYCSPYFVTDPERMVAEYDNCRILLVDKKISNARDIVGILEGAIRGNYPIMIMAEEIEQEALATLVVNKLRGNLRVIAVKAPGFGERKTQYLEDIAILTGGTVVKDELGITLDKADESVLGVAAKVEILKERTVIVGDGSTEAEVAARVRQIKTLVQSTEQDYEREKLNERVARLSGGVAIIQVGGQTETELKEKKLRVEDALCATRAAVEEGIVIGGGCTMLKLSKAIDGIKLSTSPPSSSSSSSSSFFFFFFLFLFVMMSSRFPTRAH